MTKARGRAEVRSFSFGQGKLTVLAVHLGGYVQWTSGFKEFKGKLCAGEMTARELPLHS